MNIIDVNVPSYVLGFQTFLSLGSTKLEGRLHYSNSENSDLDENMSKGDRLFNIHCLNLVDKKLTSLL